MKSARYRLAKYSDGIGHFAEVAVECSDVADGPVVQIASSAIEGRFDDWRSAAEQGFWYALRHAAPPVQLSGLCVLVTSIVGLLVDTRESAVAAAAAHATWDALGVE